MTKIFRGLLVSASVASLLVGVAVAEPVPYSAVSGGQPVAITTPGGNYSSLAGQSDSSLILTALSAAKSGDVSRVRAARDTMSDPLARKIALWALIDSNPTSVSFLEADSARRDLVGWPRAARRQAAAERLLDTSGLPPQQIIAWFDGAEPETAEGGLALAAALRSLGRNDESAKVLRRFWRTKVFEADVQSRYLDRFSDLLTQEDHAARADILLYGQQGPAARQVVNLLTGSERTAADARIAIRAGSSSADGLIETLPERLVRSSGVVTERLAAARRRGDNDTALYIARFKVDPPTDEAAAKVWADRKPLVGYAIKKGDYAGAYAAAAGAGLKSGADAAESEFFAGWIALTRLKDPNKAAAHFANIAAIGSSPITRGRALYWQGRAAEAQGDPIAAQAFYSEGARYITTFYGQLSAEKVGIKSISLGKDPVITAADRARFEDREPIRAARLLAQIGARDTFKLFVLAIDDILPTAAEEALLVDLARSYGDTDLAMRAVRTAAQRGFMLPERGYPLLSPPTVPGAAETAFVFSISRQESNFDPSARSAPGARGMMQLMPATAAGVARRLGEPYSVDRLYDADYNVKLGSYHLGEMVNTFSGSYLMAAAAYNAGPGRPTEWTAYCGDPRGGATDPLDYIECIPFSETRNYVMRTLETTMVYRARLAGGEAPLTLSQDLKRGGYGVGPQPYTVIGTTP